MNVFFQIIYEIIMLVIFFVGIPLLLIYMIKWSKHDRPILSKVFLAVLTIVLFSLSIKLIFDTNSIVKSCSNSFFDGKEYKLNVSTNLSDFSLIDLYEEIELLENKEKPILIPKNNNLSLEIQDSVIFQSSCTFYIYEKFQYQEYNLTIKDETFILTWIETINNFEKIKSSEFYEFNDQKELLEILNDYLNQNLNELILKGGKCSIRYVTKKKYLKTLTGNFIKNDGTVVNDSTSKYNHALIVYSPLSENGDVYYIID